MVYSKERAGAPGFEGRVEAEIIGIKEG